MRRKYFTTKIQGRLCEKILELANEDKEADLGYWTRKFLMKKLGIETETKQNTPKKNYVSQREPNEGFCLMCGKSLFGKRSDAKFCCAICRVKHHEKGGGKK